MYLEYFGFREKPFNVTPDPRFFYTNPIYQETYAGLLYGIRERKGFISLIGEVGTGKTTLLRKLMSELREPVHFVYLCYTTLTFEELLSFICADLGLVLGEKTHLQKIQALNDFLLNVAREGGTGVLLVDEAQNLADDVLENLRLLSNLETVSEKLLQIILVGQPELERKLAQPKLRQLKQRIAIQGRLGRLKEREVEPFILSRLAAAAYEGKSLFTPEAIQRIAAYSKGTPRLINVICDNALLVAYSLNQKTVQAEVIEEVARDLQLKHEVRPARVGGGQDAAGGGEPLHDEGEAFADRQLSVVRSVSRIVTPGTEISPPKKAHSLEDARPSRRLSRVIAGAVLALVLLGGAGATIFPEQTPREFSDVAAKVGEWLRSKINPVVGEGEDLRGGNPFSPAPSSEPSKNQSLKAVEEIQDTPPLALPKRGEEARPAGPGGPAGRLQAASPPGADASSWKNHPVRIESKMTVFDLVLKNYGSFNILAVDLIREHNPHLKNLEKIMVGEKIWLPPLNQETLMREQPDGAYQLILASFRNRRDAERFAQGVRAQGYTVVVTPRKIIENLVVQRVEIQGLKDIAAVEKAWNLVNVSNVFSGNLPLTNSRVAAVVPMAER